MTDQHDSPGDPGTDRNELAQRVEQALLGGERRYTRIEVTKVAGVELDRVRKLWMAMGFAEVGDEDVVFTDGDVEAVRLLDTLVGLGAIDSADEVSVARTLGQTLSRLADWQANQLLSRVRELGAGTEDVAPLAGSLLPVMEGLQSYVWRRHLAAAAGRALSAPDEELTAHTLVVGFADIVGYTSTTRHADIESLAALLEAFEYDAAETIAAHRGRVVKTVGDEVLFVADSAADAAGIAVALTNPDRDERGLPTLRVGLARGQVLLRFGDVYGSVVNLAARLTALARPGTALVDREMADALASEPDFTLRSLRPASVRGYQHLRSWALRPSAEYPSE
ncbi:MAG TPA: adenylate/guanylate cyclase domain-containing protein [Pseudonocardiaceae bacterium]|nr:adenylate/guanylate cyclase domain-containing protein [Pseudonocardiaceae bacterium]